MVKAPIVLDATVLIGLDRIGQLDLIPSLCDPVWVTPEVAAEFGRLQPWMSVQSAPNRALVRSLELTVDAGEASAIALASEKNSRILLDDRKARIAARQLGLTVTGTVGLLLKAKAAGRISLLLPLIDALDQAGFHLSADLRMEALRLAGEGDHGT